MLKLNLLLAQRHAVTDIVMYTFSHLVKFYKAASFKLPGITFFHDAYQREMTVMYLDVQDFTTNALVKRTRLSEMLAEVHLQV